MRGCFEKSEERLASDVFLRGSVAGRANCPSKLPKPNMPKNAHRGVINWTDMVFFPVVSLGMWLCRLSLASKR